MAVAYDVPIPGYYTRFSSTCMSKEDRTMHVHTLSSTCMSMRTGLMAWDFSGPAFEACGAACSFFSR